MPLSRRSLFQAAGVIAMTPMLPGIARAADPLPPDLTSQRAIGKPGAPAKAIEFFSLTCTHCAAFSRETMPQVRTELIDTGKLFYVFRDFPLDQLALTAAMVARALPAERYDPFVTALLASQDRWAFAEGANTTEEIWKTAALAGMSRATFDATVSDATLKAAILKEQGDAEKTYQIDSTPTFIINGKKHAGELTFDEFKGMVAGGA